MIALQETKTKRVYVWERERREAFKMEQWQRWICRTITGRKNRRHTWYPITALGSPPPTSSTAQGPSASPTCYLQTSIADKSKLDVFTRTQHQNRSTPRPIFYELAVIDSTEFYMTLYLEKERIFEQWRTSQAFVLHKKGDRKDIRNTVWYSC